MKFKVYYKDCDYIEEHIEADDCYLDQGFVCFRNQGTMQAVKMISCDNVLKVDLID